MPDAARKRISDFLRREATPLAREAARLFLQQVDLGTRVSPAGDKADEAQAILEDSFKRLAGVVALGIQVDEPGLVSEELQWLERATGAQVANNVEPPLLDLLVCSFEAACSRPLSAEDRDLLGQLLSQARSGLTDLEPLLTDPGTRPHIGNSTAQDH
ncbi:MAG: hypothetical protein QOH93_3055 [Chloroflexia bacterium]|nr:hypothetical protein [Chloroflexia bacterium]